MDKKLPKVFANEINHDINNNEKYYKSNESKKDLEVFKIDESNQSINEKINKLFLDSIHKYIIKAKIITVDDVIETKIVGRNRNSILTLDKKVIPIKDIVDIESI